MDNAAHAVVATMSAARPIPFRNNAPKARLEPEVKSAPASQRQQPVSTSVEGTVFRTTGKLAYSPAPLPEPDGSRYSVAFEMALPVTAYPGKDYGFHFRAANKALIKAMESDEVFSNLITNLGMTFKTKPDGKINLSTSPNNFVWHHDVKPGIMQLVPKNQHATNSIYWLTLHPNGVGGMHIWGVPLLKTKKK